MKNIFLIIALFASSSWAEDYKDGGVVVIRLSDKANIPKILDNRDYREYLEWVANGGVTIPRDPLPLPTKSDIDLLKAEIAAIKVDLDKLKVK